MKLQGHRVAFYQCEIILCAVEWDVLSTLYLQMIWFRFSVMSFTCETNMGKENHCLLNVIVSVAGRSLCTQMAHRIQPPKPCRGSEESIETLTIEKYWTSRQVPFLDYSYSFTHWSRAIVYSILSHSSEDTCVPWVKLTAWLAVEGALTNVVLTPVQTWKCTDSAWPDIGSGDGKDLDFVVEGGRLS